MFLTHPNNSLIKNIAFRVTLLVGILAVTVSVIVTFAFTSSGKSCADPSYCINSGYSYDSPYTCIQSEAYYCCGIYSSGSYQCGVYSNCYYIGTRFQDCTGVIAAQYTTGSIALVCLVLMIVIANKHKKKVRALVIAHHIRRQDNIVFTDQRPIRPEPPRPVDHPHGINQTFVAQWQQ